jgi:hypothetical protein
MKIFLSIAATLAWLFGAVQLVAPMAFYRQTGMELTPLLATIVQTQGAMLFGMGVVIWLARGATGQGLVAVLAGNLVVQVLSLFVVLRTMTLGVGMSVAPPVIIHVVLGSFYLYFLTRSRAAGAPAA